MVLTGKIFPLKCTENVNKMLQISLNRSKMHLCIGLYQIPIKCLLVSWITVEHYCTHIRILGQFPGHERDGVGRLLQPNLVPAVLHHRHLLQPITAQYSELSANHSSVSRALDQSERRIATSPGPAACRARCRRGRPWRGESRPRPPR